MDIETPTRVTFIRIESENMDDEWGVFVANFIPARGDHLHLSIGKPDKRADDYVEAVVIKREWYLGSDELNITVKLLDTIPEGFIPDSAIWPSVTYTERFMEHVRRAPPCVQRAWGYDPEEPKEE